MSVRVAWWARAAAACSAVTLVLFVLALLAVNERAATVGGQDVGPYALPMRIGVVVLGVLFAGASAWHYEQLARGRFEGQPRWRLLRAWWAVVVIAVLIAVSWPAPWAPAAWIAALGWAAAASRASYLDRASPETGLGGERS